MLNAEQIAQEQGKKRNATHIAQAVQAIKQPLFDDTTMQQPSSEPNHSSVNEDVSPLITTPLQNGDLDPEPSENVQNMSNEQIAPLLQAIAHRASETDALDNQPDTELKQMLKNALQIAKNVKRKLNQRRYTNN